MSATISLRKVGRVFAVGENRADEIRSFLAAFGSMLLTSNTFSAPERLFTVRETAQILGLCIDSVRRHLRSGRIVGVRVGGSWRVPERVLLAQLGLATPQLSEEEAQPQIPPLDSEAVSFVPKTTLQMAVLCDQTKTLVEKAARHANLSRPATERLLAELDDLLSADWQMFPEATKAART